ncbi:DUF7289 family protein [Halorarius halobius]|uniref:DUF7289 family protein n=1 Tax=Halorarius halobius TaxID=2962671 RepID=UPI0020CBAD83|nr:hypothetical protein [Halorarius halobius]
MVRVGVRGQSGPLGFALVLGITMIGAVAAAVLGGAALTDTQQTAEFDQAQQALTQFDSTASQVALGRTDTQTVALGGAEGTYRIDPDAGYVTIKHYNYSGTSDHVIYENDLGAVVYEQDGRSVAYQGGGVWSSYGDGTGRIVSPPEFHYRGATLTFPMVRVTGSGGISGSSSAVVRQSAPTNVVFPDPSVTSPHTYQNPQTNGNIQVKIESRYYEAWASYFRERTAGRVTTYDSNETVRVKLVSLGIGPGSFDMPGEGGAVELRGLSSGHAIDEFNITLRPTQGDSANFNNLQWSLYAESGNGQKRLEIHLRQGDGGNCDDLTADMMIYYTDDGGSSYQSWVKEDAFRGQCNADNEVRLVANLTNASQSMSYQSIGNNALLSTTPAKANGAFLDPVTIASHPGHGANQYGSGHPTSEKMDFLVRHYIANFGNEVDLEVYDKNGNGGSVSEGLSSGNIRYGGSGQYVTYMHVTENEVTVEFR